MHLYDRRNAPVVNPNDGGQASGINIFVQQLVPLQVERKLEFLLSSVPVSSHFYYMRWFLEAIKLEFGQESESMLVDIVRYVVVNIHPPDEIIQSENYQRYMLIGNLIQQ